MFDQTSQIFGMNRRTWLNNNPSYQVLILLDKFHRLQQSWLKHLITNFKNLLTHKLAHFYTLLIDLPAKFDHAITRCSYFLMFLVILRELWLD